MKKVIIKLHDKLMTLPVSEIHILIIIILSISINISLFILNFLIGLIWFSLGLCVCVWLAYDSWKNVKPISNNPFKFIKYGINSIKLENLLIVSILSTFGLLLLLLIIFIYIGSKLSEDAHKEATDKHYRRQKRLKKFLR